MVLPFRAGPFVESRRAPRAVFRLPCSLLRKREEIPLRSEDVSFTGLFIAMEEPPPKHQLIRLRLLLPPYDRALLTHAMVIHVTPPALDATNRRSPGVGVQLYAVDRATRVAWETFVTRVLGGELGEDGWSAFGQLRGIEPERAAPPRMDLVPASGPQAVVRSSVPKPKVG
jgi:hypothetical protein